MKTNEEYVEELGHRFGHFWSKRLGDNVIYGGELDKNPNTWITVSREDIELWLRTTLEAKDKECKQRLAQEREKVLKEISEVVGVEAKRLDTASQHGEFGSGQRDGIFYLDDAVQTIITKKLEALAPTKTDKQTEV